MQDRFRLRVYDNVVKKYLSDNDVYEITDGILDNLYDLLDEENMCFILGRHDLIFELCTGLKDKNGKLIYEGDILNIKYRAAPDLPRVNLFEGNCIEYDNDKAEYSISKTIGKRKEKISLSSLIGDESDISGDESDISVIGNIHENPELLEEE